jgi:hypothetical protein
MQKTWYTYQSQPKIPKQSVFHKRMEEMEDDGVMERMGMRVMEK